MSVIMMSVGIKFGKNIMIKSISKCKGFFSAGSENNKSFAKYTVVSACYNVSSYLEDYFNSMVRQTIGFNNVFIISVTFLKRMAGRLRQEIWG